MKISNILFIAVVMIASIGFLTYPANATSYGYDNPYALQVPGRVISGVETLTFLMSNGSYIHEYGTYENYTFDSTAGGRKPITGGGTKLKFAIADWTDGKGIFFVDTDLNVGHTSDGGSVDYSLGWYDPGTWELGCALSGNCNQIYKLGVVSTFNNQPSAFVDSNEDFYLADGLTVIKYSKSTEYYPQTYMTLVSGTSFTAPACSAPQGGSCQLTPQIADMKIDSNGYLHILVGSTAVRTTGLYGGVNANINHLIYSGTTQLKNYTLVNYGFSGGGVSGTLTADLSRTAMLIDETNYSNISLGWKRVGTTETADVFLTHFTGSTSTDICSGACSLITSFSGIAQLGSYVYISSPDEDKIYRFPTTFESGTGYGYGGTQGGITEGTGLITYDTKTVVFDQDTYHNNSDFRILYDLKFTVNDTTKSTMGDLFGWNTRVTNPSGTPVSSDYNIIVTCAQESTWWLDFVYNTGDWSCSGNAAYFVDPPVGNWTNGTYTASLYETFETTPYLLDTDTVTVLNESGFTGITTPDTTPIGGGISQINGTWKSTQENIADTCSYWDTWVRAILGSQGVNDVSRLMFALGMVVAMMFVGLVASKGNFGVAVILGFFPYAFFSYLTLSSPCGQYIPLWINIFIALIIGIKMKWFS